MGTAIDVAGIATAETPRVRRPVPAETAIRDVVVVIPTYNEAANIRRMIRAALNACDRADVLVVDDHSPDGTAELVETMAPDDPRIHLLRRRGPRGLGAAYMAGFRWALRRSYTHVVQMDADFSHDPAAIPELLRHADRHDLVIGSRYCAGGKTEGWPKRRQWLSFAANLYARSLLGSRIADLTGGFKCWRREVLERIDFARLCCDGYGFQVEMNHLAELGGVRIREAPITFRERRDGVSKLKPGVANNAAIGTARLAWNRLIGRAHPALLPEPTAKRPVRRDQVPRRVVVMCLGGIGDVVLAFAMFRRLRQQLPEAHLTALTMWPQAADLLEDLGVFDEVRQHNFQTDRAWRSLRTLGELHRRRFDLSILTMPTNRWEFCLAAWLIHARRRIGHTYLGFSEVRGLRWLLTDRVRQQPKTHVIDENLRLLPAVPNHPSSAPDIRLGGLAAEYHGFAEKLLADIPGPYLGIHAGSSTGKNLAAKRWPKDRFAELCRLAHEQLGLTPLLFGCGAEVELNKWIAARAPGARVIVTPTIRHTAAVMRRCAAFVSNDSALAHIASALDVPTVMIVGPTDPDSIRPYPGHGVAVTAGLPCTPCYRPNATALACVCDPSYACLLDLAPAKVLQSVAEEVVRTWVINGPWNTQAKR